MPRLNIYIPDDLAEELKGLPGEINLSRVCASALRDAVAAGSTLRAGGHLPHALAGTFSMTGRRLTHRYRIRDIVTGSHLGDYGDPRETVALLAAEFLDQVLATGGHLGIGGGTQVWAAVRRLKPRSLRLSISAIGYGHVDRRVPHVHPNALATFLSLVYAPRSTSLLVGAPEFSQTWASSSQPPPDVCRVIVGSCAPLDASSAHAQVLGPEITDVLVEEGALGDFLGVFLAADGRVVEPYPPGATVSYISAADLREHARRPDTIVALAAAGPAKLGLIRHVLQAELCNTLITDETTAVALTR